MHRMIHLGALLRSIERASYHAVHHVNQKQSTNDNERNVQTAAKSAVRAECPIVSSSEGGLQDSQESAMDRRKIPQVIAKNQESGQSVWHSNEEVHNSEFTHSYQHATHCSQIGPWTPPIDFQNKQVPCKSHPRH